ncbi:MAG TPA: hypothetical protein ENK18_23920 [Deltaproteobacteria bacterium]|nr:hypothetical protein [Deltaproteobacteria bacterium]
MQRLGGSAARLAEGTPEVRNRALVVCVPAGRALAEARRCKTVPQVARALYAHFPGLELEVAPLAGTGTPTEHQRALQQEVLDDPACRRIIQTLEAKLEAVTSLRDEAP